MAQLKKGSTLATTKRREMKILGYPCRQTMGAFLRFKRETGREATEITNDLTDLLTFLYCCTQGRRIKIFTYIYSDILNKTE